MEKEYIEEEVLVSVIVPSFNHGLFLKERIDSILNQSFQNFELILLDDNSTDDSKEIILSFQGHPKVSHVILNEVNSGNPFGQWKKGVSFSKGKIIWIAESDDYASSDFLQRLLPFFGKEEKLAIAFAESIIVEDFRETGITFSEKYYSGFFASEEEIILNGCSFIEKYLIYRNVIPNVSAALIKREMFNLYLENVEKVEKCGDWLFYLQCLINYNVAYLPAPLSYFRRHANSVIRSTTLPASFYDSKLRYFYNNFLINNNQEKLAQKSIELYFDEIAKIGIYRLRYEKNLLGILQIVEASLNAKTLKYIRATFWGLTLKEFPKNFNELLKKSFNVFKI